MVSSLINTNQLEQSVKIAIASLDQEIASNQDINNTQTNESLDLYPVLDDNAMMQIVFMDELIHTPRESQAKTRYAIGLYCWQKGNCDLAKRFMLSVIEQYPDCNTTKEAKSKLESWQVVGQESTNHLTKDQ
jgi:hypothetical protein